MNAIKHIIAPQSYGYIQGDDDLSPGANGSRARLLWVATLIGAGVIPRKSMVLFPQGYSKKCPTEATTENKVSLGKMMADYLRTRPEMQWTDVLHQPLGWGTFADVSNVVLMAKRMNIAKARVHFVSDRVHLQRVQMIWNRVAPTDWDASFHASPFHRMSFKERWLREPLARAHYWLRI